jgi:hypothetical protein
MSSSVLIRISQYIHVRFSPFQMLPLALVFGLACLMNFSITNWIIVTSALLLYLFELRLFDEFKDFEHDKKYYPNRPVQRGIIGLSELKPILGIVILLQILLVIFYLPNIYLFGFVQIYTLIISREFFLKSWMVKHFSINIILHEIVTPFLFLFLFSFSSHVISRQTIFYSFLYGINFFLLEVGRKLIPREPTHKANDTYVERYTNRGVALLIFILSGLSVLISFIVVRRNIFMIPLIFYLPLFIYLLSKYSTKKWQIYGNILFLGLIILVFIDLIVLSLAKFL